MLWFWFGVGGAEIMAPKTVHGLLTTPKIQIMLFKSPVSYSSNTITQDYLPCAITALRLLYMVS